MDGKKKQGRLVSQAMLLRYLESQPEHKLRILAIAGADGGTQTLFSSGQY